MRFAPQAIGGPIAVAVWNTVESDTVTLSLLGGSFETDAPFVDIIIKDAPVSPIETVNMELPAPYEVNGGVLGISVTMPDYDLEWKMNEGTGTVAKCSDTQFNATVDEAGWAYAPSNSKRWPINEGTGALLSEVQTGTSEYDATIQNFDESGWD